MNRDDPTNRLEQRQALSALVDGEGADADQVFHAWRDGANARADWHTYHLIGELMRSDDVRCDARHDAGFLGRLRERLAAEPVVLAPVPPTPAVQGGGWRRAWLAPMAVAAGFVAVAGVLVVTRMAAPDGAAQDRSVLLASPSAAQAASGLQSAAAGATPSAPALAGLPRVEGTLIRNAELDRYLAAHQQYSTTSAVAVPGGAVRKAAAVSPGR
jgi:sigma-E factor negative regulatory protein RseA